MSPTKTIPYTQAGGAGFTLGGFTNNTSDYSVNTFNAFGNLPQHCAGSNPFFGQITVGIQPADDPYGSSGKLANLRH